MIYVRTPPHTQKVKNVRRDPRVVAQVEDGVEYLRLRAAIVKGRAEIVEEPAELAWFAEQFAAKYTVSRAPVALPAVTRRHYGPSRVVIKVVPIKVRTWDNAKLRVGAST